MKTLLITHVDLDGISPIILLNLTGIKFDYKCLDINEIDSYFDELFIEEYKKYDNFYVVDLTLTEHVYNLIQEKNINIKVFDHHETHLFANKYDFVKVAIDLNGKPTCGTELFYDYLKNEFKDLKKDIIKYYVDLVRQLDTFRFESDIPRDLENLRSTIGSSSFIKSITRRLKKNTEFSFNSFEKRLLKIKQEEKNNYMLKREENLKRYKIDGKICGVVFAERYKSDLGEYLSNKYTDLDLIILIDASSRISYRSSQSKEDVNLANFAQKYGGGGHMHASGSNFSDDYRDKIVKEYFNGEKLD